MKSSQSIQIDFPLENLYCPITKQIMFDPVILHPCEHVVEKEIFEEWVKKQASDCRCPVCRKEVMVIIDLPLAKANKTAIV